ncbi:hypothetical protein FSARC_15017 [Fusarium sarcochroum]|uniref:C2H2-type domain-containing protein n=1 Tax=Fusarium sarcochroum TaxID=1208366 RepID=A0A8H4SPD9_9HYPO|nr:hypothetical protein FSARC_15017 [Fusarium sarcochroum]
MDDFSRINIQPRLSTTIITGFPFYLQAFNPFSPTSPASSFQHSSSTDFSSTDIVTSSWLQMASPALTFMLSPTESELNHTCLPSSPNYPAERKQPNFGYKKVSDTGMLHHTSPSLSAISIPSSAYEYFPDTYMGASFIMPPTQNLSHADATGLISLWPYTHDSLSLFTPQEQPTSDWDLSNSVHCPRSPPSASSLHDSTTTHQMRPQYKIKVHKASRETPEIHQAGSRFSKKKHSMVMATEVGITRKAIHSCDYPWCHKAFRRTEHLKRHKQAFHGEGPNRFLCEFCGKDQFNRFDNLQVHRRLHTRLVSGNYAVKFVPEAVAVTEQEERTRKRRAPPKHKKVTAKG